MTDPSSSSRSWSTTTWRPTPTSPSPLVNKDVEKLRQDFLTTSLGGQAPELLWTVSDHVGPFTTSDVILPWTASRASTCAYLPNALESVQLDGQTWGLPISFGNHLMLYANKDLISECPADCDA